MAETGSRRTRPTSARSRSGQVALSRDPTTTRFFALKLPLLLNHPDCPFQRRHRNNKHVRMRILRRRDFFFRLDNYERTRPCILEDYSMNHRAQPAIVGLRICAHGSHNQTRTGEHNPVTSAVSANFLPIARRICRRWPPARDTRRQWRGRKPESPKGSRNPPIPARASPWRSPLAFAATTHGASEAQAPG